MPKTQKLLELPCWEVMKCGREPGGVNSARGVCPAATPKNGRRCWAVKRTLCHGATQNGLTDKLECCLKCRFFLSVVGQQTGGKLLLERLFTQWTPPTVCPRHSRVKLGLTTVKSEGGWHWVIQTGKDEHRSFRSFAKQSTAVREGRKMLERFRQAGE